MITRTGKNINPLDVQSHEVSVIDMIHALSYQPMFGGMLPRFYSKAEHICFMFDSFTNNTQYWIDKATKKSNHKILEIKMKKVKLFLLFYFGGEAYLTGVIGKFQAWNHHNPRVIGALLTNIGEEYKDFKRCMPLFEMVDTECRKSISLLFNDKSNISAFYNPYMAMKEFISRYNRVSDVPIYILGKDVFELNHIQNSMGDFDGNWDLPTIREW